MKTNSIFKGIAALFSAAVLASSLTGCASNSESKAPSSDAESKTQSSKAESQPTSSETETVTINLADQSANTVLFFHYAYDTGILEKNFADYNVKFEIINSESGPAVNEGIASNQIDFAILGNLPAISGAANGYGSEIIAIGASSLGGSMSVAVAPDSGINSFADLKGKTVGVAIGTGFHLSLSQALSAEGLTLDDLNLINLKPADGVTAIRNNSVDAACILPSQLSQLEEEGSAKSIKTNLPKQPSSFIVARKAFVEKYPEYTEALLKSLNETYKLIESDWDAFGKYYNEFIGTDASAIIGSMKKSEFGITSINGSNKEALDEILSFAVKNGLVTNSDVKLEDIVDDTLAKKAGF